MKLPKIPFGNAERIFCFPKIQKCLVVDYCCSFFVPIELSIDSIGDIVLALVNTGWIYFPPIKYCILVLTDPNHLSLLALRLEEDGGTFKGTKTPLSVFFEARTFFG